MANVVQLQTNFTAGEISPRLFGRADLAKYNNGAKTIENALVEPHGGLSRRPGTKYVSAIKSADFVPRLAEFHFNTEQSYVLEIGVTEANGNPGDTSDEDATTIHDGASTYYGANAPNGAAYEHGAPESHGYIRFYKVVDGVPTPLYSSGTTYVEMGTMPWVDVELAKLNFVQSADTLFIFCPTRPVLKIQRTGADNVDANWKFVSMEKEVGFVDGPYQDTNTDDIYLTPASTDVGDRIIKATTSDGATPVYHFTKKDIGRVIRLEDPVNGHKVQNFFKAAETASSGALVRVVGRGLFDAAQAGAPGSDFGTGVKIEFFEMVRGPTFLDGTLHVTKGMAYTELGDFTSFTLQHADTAQAETYADSQNYANASIDGYARIFPAEHTGWGYIKDVVASTEGSVDGAYSSVTVAVKKKFISVEATQNWRMGAWSKTTGYPENGTFHQNRLWAAATKDQPQTLFASETNVYDTFSPTNLKTGQVTDNQALNLTLASRHVNGITHMKSDTQGLLIFTTGGEWLGRASQPGSPITPTDLSFTKQSGYGSVAGVEPVRLGHSHLLFQRDARILREYTYEFGSDKFLAPNVTLMSEHITANKVVDVSFQTGSTNRLWCATSTGELLALTYDKLQEVLGWTRHPMAVSGTGGSANTAGEVKAISRTLDGNDDNIWVLVKRKKGTGDVYYIEMLSQDFLVTDDHNKAVFLDSASVQTLSARTTWTGLDHLDGEVVYTLENGVAGGPYTVSSNEITGTTSVTQITIGLRYKTTVETVPLNVNQNIQFRGRMKRAVRAFVNMYRSISGKFGINDDTADNLLYDIEYPTATATPPELRTAMVEFSVPGLSERELILRYEQEDGHPANILAITSEVALGD